MTKNHFSYYISTILLLYYVTSIGKASCSGFHLPSSSPKKPLLFISKQQQKQQPQTIQKNNHASFMASTSITFDEFNNDSNNIDDDDEGVIRENNVKTPPPMIEHISSKNNLNLQQQQHLTTSTSAASTRNPLATALQIFTNILQKQYRSYMTILQTKPFLTKSLTSGVISAIGDIFAQYLESSTSTLYLLNWSRLLSFFLSGTFFVGPFLSIWYDCLWSMGRIMERHSTFGITGGKGGGRKKSLVLMVVDQILGVALFFPAYFYVYEYTEALVGWRAPVYAIATSKIRTELFSILMMNYRVWPILNFINFEYIPENLRVLVSNIASVFWNIYLCTRVAA